MLDSLLVQFMTLFSCSLSTYAEIADTRDVTRHKSLWRHTGESREKSPRGARFTVSSVANRSASAVLSWSRISSAGSLQLSLRNPLVMKRGRKRDHIWSNYIEVEPAASEFGEGPAKSYKRAVCRYCNGNMAGNVSRMYAHTHVSTPGPCMAIYYANVQYCRSDV